jgi:UDP-N-acetylmuramoyl-L-alanyl-D-glutamate--2,6-diaminopimelate ligase
MDCMGGDQAPLVVVDYAHTPDALENALSALRPVADARAGALWCVFGCGGDRDAGKRPAMGAIAMQGADLVIVTSDNPRTERPESIIAQILAGMSTQRAPRVLMDRAQAIAEAVTQATERDVVLIAGKGHESTQEIGGQKFEFSDKDHARLALLARSAALEAAP